MWIVRLALKKPYTFVVVAMLVLIFGIGFIIRMPKDIFPEIDIPIITLMWLYNGLPAEEFEQRITTYSELSISNYVNDVEKIESQTTDGLSFIRVYFHPEANVNAAIAQATATSQNVIKRMPEGIIPPMVLRYSTSSVPIIQVVLSSELLDESQVFDYAQLTLRQKLATIRGTTIPSAIGGKIRQVMVDIDPEALQAKGLSARDVNNAVNGFNITLPTGNAKIGEIDYRVNLNMSPDHIADINDFPVKVTDDAIIYLRDVAFAHDGFIDQTNIVRNQGEKSVILAVIKNGVVSTLQIIENLKNMLPDLRAAAPEGMVIKPLFDQSIFVKAAIQAVAVEGVIAAGLTGLFLLIFLGSWRSTLIVNTSIPLSVLASIILLALTGQTLNIMTLGGLALSIGILVDEAIVTVENIHRHIDTGKPLHHAILDGSSQVAIPAFVSMLCICIVFLPIAGLVGPVKFLFTPFAYAVVFAVAASYFFSRTLVPVMMKYIFAKEVHVHQDIYNQEPPVRPSQSFFRRFYNRLEGGYIRVRKRYEKILDWCIYYRGGTCFIFLLLFASSALILPFIGRDFFPHGYGNHIRLHVKAPTGTRLEVTETIFDQVEAEIRNIIPPDEIDALVDNIGVPSEPSSLAFRDNATIGPYDGEILITLNDKQTLSTSEYMVRMRKQLNEKFPHLVFFYQPAGMINQILYFGLPTPINVKVVGRDKAGNIAIAKDLVERISHIPGAVDVHLHQVLDAPELYLKVNPTLLAEKGLNQRDLTTDILLTYSTSAQVEHTFWLDRKAGIPYLIAIQFPKYRLENTQQFMSMPLQSPLIPSSSPLLTSVAQLERRTGPGVITHLNIQPSYDIYVNVQDRDLGGVSSDIAAIVDEVNKTMKPGNKILIRGIVEDMNTIYKYLLVGFLLSALLIYFILVINFQSWIDPFIVILAIPGSLTGVFWMLFLTRTHFSVPAIMGIIMCIGVATANTILVVTFANFQLLKGKPNFEAVHRAASTRLRPVLMTALAMIIGMMPMAIGIGEGSDQNAPLGRAVIGGLFMATLTTLFFVPVIFSVFRKIPNPHIEYEEPSSKL